MLYVLRLTCLSRITYISRITNGGWRSRPRERLQCKRKQRPAISRECRQHFPDPSLIRYIPWSTCLIYKTCCIAILWSTFCSMWYCNFVMSFLLWSHSLQLTQWAQWSRIEPGSKIKWQNLMRRWWGPGWYGHAWLSSFIWCHIYLVHHTALLSWNPPFVWA